MQKVLETKNIDNGRPNIPVMGKEVYLKEVVSIGGAAEEGYKCIETFDGGGIYPPCTTIWYTSCHESDPEFEEHVITSLSEIGTAIFGMTAEDAETLERYMLDAAAQLGVDIIFTENAIVLTSHLLQERAKAGDSWASILEEAKTNRDISISLGSMGAATIIGKAIELGMKMYDRINYHDKVDDIASIIRSCRHIGPNGHPVPLSVQEVDGLLENVKSKLTIYIYE